MTSPKTPPGLLLPGTQVHLSLDITETDNPDRFAFVAMPAAGEKERGWRIHGDVYRTEHGLAVKEIAVKADLEGSAEVTGTLMRQIPIGTILDYVRGQVSAKLTEGLPKAPAASGAVSAGRTEMTDSFLRSVAISYLLETAPGKPPGGTRRLAESYGRPEQTIRTWVSRARKEGWLGPSARGRAGAEPGPRMQERAMFELLDGSERVLTFPGSPEYDRLSQSDKWRRLSSEETRQFMEKENAANSRGK
ncbi:hypothetical protein [Streptomyces cinereoruber]|uniref:hypothetical protein n=1 Tax=Streptomyces cinereoruber TaxID=67260 RepID=UPI0036461E88